MLYINPIKNSSSPTAREEKRYPESRKLLEELMQPVVIGIDGGATRTRAVLVDLQGRLLGLGFGGPSNYDDVGIPTAGHHLTAAIHQALDDAGGPGSIMVKAVFFGMAGVVSQSDRKIIQEIALTIPEISGAIRQVDHDLRIAHAGGLAGKPGIVLIAGTGSSCYGTNPLGQDLRVGGWGHLLDDGGSSYSLGLHAIMAVTRGSDGRMTPPSFTGEVLQQLGIQDVQEVMWRVYHKGLKPAEIASLAPLVTRAAEQGDAVARQIVQDGVHELALLVQTAAQQLGFSGAECNIVLTGGLAQSSSYYRAALVAAIQERLPGGQIQDPRMPPALGAVLLALNAAGVPTTLDLVEALVKVAQSIHL